MLISVLTTQCFSFDQEDDEAPSENSENGAEDSSDNDGKKFFY